MKLFNLILLLLGSTICVFAQHVENRDYQLFEKHKTANPRISLRADNRDAGDVLASDNFSDPSNWSLYADSDTEPNWEIVSETPEVMIDYLGAFAGPGAADGFAIFNGIQYLLAGEVVPIDAVLAYNESINCSAATAVHLEAFMAYKAFNSDTIFVEVSNDDWASFTVFPLYDEVVSNTPTIQETILLDITSTAAGESNVKIRFRFKELGADPDFGAGYGCMIDDFIVKEAWDYDVTITETHHFIGEGLYFDHGLDYYFIPKEIMPSPEMSFSGEILSVGGVTQPNAKLNVEVAGEGTFSGTSPAVDLAIGESDSLSISSTFSLSSLGDYELKYFADSDGVEEATWNDTLQKMVHFTNYIYSRDNGIPTGEISNVHSNSGNPFLIGNIMEMYEDGDIGAITVHIDEDETNIGQIIYGQVMRYNPDTEDFFYLGKTEDHTVNGDENGTLIELFFFDDCPIVYEGDVLLVLAGHYGGDDQVGFRTAQSVRYGSVMGYTSGASEPFVLNAPSAIMVRLDFRGYLCTYGIQEETANFDLSQNTPNPFNENTIINYSLNEAATVNVAFVDISGKHIKTIHQGQQKAGDYTLEVLGNDFAEGVYFYTFTVGNESITKRMVVMK
jgi:hypothetical protein